MAYLIQISKEGQFQELPLQKKITTLGATQDADFIFDTAHKDAFYQIIQSDEGYQILGLTPKALIQHQGKKKQNLRLSTYDFFEIDQNKFIFSTKRVQVKKEDVEATNAYESFYQFSKTLSETRSSTSILKKLLDLVIQVAHAQKGFLVADENIVAARGCLKSDVEESLTDLSKNVFKKVQQTKSPVIIDNISNHPSFHPQHSVHRLELTSLACFPILIQNKLIGFLYLGSHTAEGFFDPATVRMIEILLAQAALIFENHVSIEKLEQEKQDLRAKLEGSNIIGASRIIEDVFRKIEKIAPLDLSILITGETGTGKEMGAKEIHKRTPRADQPFIAINCGAIPENLLESILFGHKKGAFTGAHEDKIGKFEAAHGGTIFLDEIAEMPFALQVKLLRVLQERVVERVGDVKEIPIDVRVVSATHQNIEKMIESGKFREDLYYRLNEIYIEIPPLRQREGDVLLLAEHFIEKHKMQMNKETVQLSKDAQEKLLHYDWPGNIRELENVVKRALVFTEANVLEAKHIDTRGQSQKLLPLKDARDRFLREYTQKMISLHDGNKSKAAKALGVSLRTLFRIEKE